MREGRNFKLIARGCAALALSASLLGVGCLASENANPTSGTDAGAGFVPDAAPQNPYDSGLHDGAAADASDDAPLDAGPDTAPPPSYVIGGNVTGLIAQDDAGAPLVLANGSDTVNVASDGPFAFPTKVAGGGTFDVSVQSSPTSPAQVCSVSGGSGTVVSDDVTSIAVNCSTSAFTLGGTVGGLAGKGLVLANGSTTVGVNANGTFSFLTPFASGTPFDVTVKTQPSTPTQVCTVTGGKGTMGSSDVATVSVSCKTSSFTVGGGVTGLTGTGLVLTNNGVDPVTVPANATSFTFPKVIASNAGYDVEIKTQPTNPTQTCTLAGNKGTVGAGKVTTVAVNCTTNKYTISGTIAGLAGTGLMLSDGTNTVAPSGNAFSFPPLPSNTPYTIKASTQPSGPWQTCTAVTAGSGTVTNADIGNVAIRCATNSYNVIATVTGLAGIRLGLNDSIDAIQPAALGKNTFPTKILSGKPYAITIGNPIQPSQTCVVTSGNASGNVAGSDVNVAIDCTTNSYTVSVAISSQAPQCGQGQIFDGTHAMTVQPPAFQQTQTFTLPALLSGTQYTASWDFSGPNSDTGCRCLYNNTSGVSGTIQSGTIGGSNLSFTISCSDIIP